MIAIPVSGKHAYAYPCGNVYTGEFDNSMRNGMGKMVYHDGGIYEGEWVNDLREGKGKMIYQPEKVYEGEWKDGKRHGNGKLTDIDSTYTGEWQYDQMHGKGEEKNKDKSYFIGSWEFNKKKGQGKKVERDGACVEGLWVDDKTMDGWVTCKDPKGMILYKALYGDGQEQKTVCPNKVVLRDNIKAVKGLPWKFEQIGNFSYLLHESANHGTILYMNGERYEGEIKNVAFNYEINDPKAISRYPANKIYSKHGKGILYNSDGSVKRGGDWHFDAEQWCVIM